MKQLFYLTALVFFLFISCEKNHDKANVNNIKISNLEFTGCTDDTKHSKSMDFCVIIKTLNNNHLEILNKNSEFCCGTESVKITYELLEDSLIIHEFDEGPYSYCFCKHDIKFKIGPLDYGNYKIILIEPENSYYRDTLFFEFNHADGNYFTNCN